MTSPIKQAVIPAAGLGTRFLPVTKVVPKELLPLADKPCIEHVIDEAIAAGVEEFIIVISHEKELLKHYFKPNTYLEEWLLARGKDKIRDDIKSSENKARFTFVYQDQPLGLGHAVLCAKPCIRDDHFLVILPDDVIDAAIPVCLQMVEVFKKEAKPVLAVMQVDWENVHHYGIVQGTPLSDNLGMVSSIIEKPKRENAPSNLAVIGRYILPKSIFPLLEKTTPGSGNEIQLTDALKDLIPQTGLQSYFFTGERYDTGNPIGLMQAGLITALQDHAVRDRLLPFIKTLSSSY